MSRDGRGPSTGSAVAVRSRGQRLPRILEQPDARDALRARNARRASLSSDLIGEGNAPLAIDALLPVPQSAEPTSVATWAYDALMALAAAEATPVSGAAALLIELPHTIVHGHPSGVPYAITLVKGLLMRERFIDGPQSLADICVRSGDHPGIYVALKPFTV